MPATQAGAGAAEPTRPLGSQVLEVIDGHREWLCSLLDLASAEARRAGLSVALMLALAGVLVVTVAASWILLCAAAVAAAVSYGLDWVPALLAAVVLNLVLSAGLALAVVRLSRNLGFTASRAALRPQATTRSGSVPGAAQGAP